MSLPGIKPKFFLHSTCNYRLLLVILEMEGNADLCHCTVHTQVKVRSFAKCVTSDCVLIGCVVSQIEDKASIIPLVAGMRREVQMLIAEVSGWLWNNFEVRHPYCNQQNIHNCTV